MNKSQGKSGYYQNLTTDVFGCELLNILCTVHCLVLVSCCVKLVLYCILMSTDPLVGPQQKKASLTFKIVIICEPTNASKLNNELG